MNNKFNITEEEKSRIRGLHKNYSVIKEDWREHELAHEELLSAIADRLYKAVKGAGTDEDEIFAALEELSTIAKSSSKWSGHKKSYLFDDLSDIYEASYGEELWDALEGDLSVADLKIVSNMTGKQVIWGGDHNMERTGYTP